MPICAQCCRSIWSPFFSVARTPSSYDCPLRTVVHGQTGQTRGSWPRFPASRRLSLRLGLLLLANTPPCARTPAEPSPRIRRETKAHREARWHAGALFFEGAPAWLTATLSAALLPGTETPQGPQCRHARRCLLAPFGRALLLGVSPLPLTMPRTHGANCGTLTVTGTVTGTKKPCYGRRAA